MDSGSFFCMVKNRLNHIFEFIKHHKIISIVVIAVILIVAFFLRPKPPKDIPTEPVTRHEIIQSVAITGSVTAEKNVDLAFQIPGKLTILNVKKGDTVTQGQTIALLDQRTSLKNLKKALLDYSIQRNTYETFAKNQQAYKPSDALNESMRRILENNQYNLDIAVNSVELQDLAREQSILTTPISGIITRADAKSNGVNIGVTTVFSVVDPTSLSFRMEVDEADISKIEPGQAVEVILNSYPDKTFKLKVSDIDFVTHTTSTGGNAFDVKAAISSQVNSPLRVGMNGNATIITNKKSNVITIPLASLLDDNTVYIKEGMSYTKKKVKLGIQSDTEAEVISGLSEGNILVLDPSQIPAK